MVVDPKLQNMSENFAIEGKFISVQPHKSGLINQSFLSKWKLDSQIKRYIHQRINHAVFPNIKGLMNNIVQITSHLRAREETFNAKVPRIVLTKNKKTFWKSPEGEFWRTYEFIERTRSVDVCSSKDQAKSAASILGRFQRALLDFDVSQLVEVIPNFQSSPHRFEQLAAAIKSDQRGRQAQSKPEIEFALARSEFAKIIDKHLRSGSIPLRATHGDMKLNNVLFASAKEKAVSIVDLDTCMLGYSLYDFGDLARNTCVQAAEDEQDFSKIEINMEFFAALVKAYRQETKSLLNQVEVSLLTQVPRLLALTLGVRFLTDFLCGDTYFRTLRPLQNLERARTQFRIVELFEEKKFQLEQSIA